MRPYFVLTVVFLAALEALGQQQRFIRPGPRPIRPPRPPIGVFGYGYGYGYGPFEPILTTPEITFQQFSPNPVGASNATTGLSAGATNATINDIPVSTDSVYTEEVWVRGGDLPVTTPEVHLDTEPIGRQPRPHAMYEEHAKEEHGEHKQMHTAWTYYAGPGEEYTSSPSEAVTPGKGARQPGHVYTNDDVTRQNDKNGEVKFKGKTEKI